MQTPCSGAKPGVGECTPLLHRPSDEPHPVAPARRRSDELGLLHLLAGASALHLAWGAGAEEGAPAVRRWGAGAAVQLAAALGVAFGRAQRIRHSPAPALPAQRGIETQLSRRSGPLEDIPETLDWFAQGLCVALPTVIGAGLAAAVAVGGGARIAVELPLWGWALWDAPWQQPPLPPATVATARTAGGLLFAALVGPYCAEVAAAHRWKRWLEPLALLWFVSCIGGAAEAGQQFLGYPVPQVPYVFFAARVPAFVFGQALAEDPPKVAGGGAAALELSYPFLLLALVLLAVPPPGGTQQPGAILAAWVGHGALLPIQAWAAVAAAEAGARCADRWLRIARIAGLLMLHAAPWYGCLRAAFPLVALGSARGWEHAAVAFFILASAAAMSAGAGWLTRRAALTGAAVWRRCVHAAGGPDDSVLRTPEAQPAGRSAPLPGDEEELREGLIGGAKRALGATMWRRRAAYYAFMLCSIGGYVGACYAHPAPSGGMGGLITVPDSVAHAMLWVRWTLVLSLPALLVGAVAHGCWPAAVFTGRTVPQGLPSDLQGRLFVRIVTRGTSPMLVRENAAAARRVLDRCLAQAAATAEVEVVTDHALSLDGIRARQIVVPEGYRCPCGARFKARALHYAMRHSPAKSSDWVLHLDEETRFTSDTLRHVLWHCATEDAAVRRGARRLPRIGQGPIVYGSRPAEVENWLTTLADSARVSDDFGKFRLSFALHEPIFGLHGSFVVVSNAVEQLVGWDHGPEGSVTEDAFFALIAREHGAGVAWIDAFMHEQSPFNARDFMKQRRRWFAGLCNLCVSSRVSCSRKGIIIVMVILWCLCSLCAPFTLLSVAGVGAQDSDTFRFFLAACAALWTWSYILGFAISYSPSGLGVVRWAVLACMQWSLCPVFLVMETGGVLWALCNPSAFSGFHVVEKQNAAVQERGAHCGKQRACGGAAGPGSP